MKWVMVYSSTQLGLAEIIKAMLVENEIDAVTLNKKDSSYLLGEVEVFVKPDDVIMAKQLISKHNS